MSDKKKSEKLNPFTKIEPGTRVTFVLNDAVISGLLLHSSDKWMRVGEAKASGQGAISKELDGGEAWVNTRNISAIWW